MRKRFIILAWAMLTGSLALGLSFYPAFGAPKYPSKPIEMVVGYGAGSATDIVARALATSARKYIDQPVVVMNKAGGGGQVGNEYVITARPDGYTIIFGYGSGETIIAPHMLKLSHNPVEAMRTVILVTETPMVIAVKGDSPFKKIKDVIEYAKQNPGKSLLRGQPGGHYPDHAGAFGHESRGEIQFHSDNGNGSYPDECHGRPCQHGFPHPVGGGGTGEVGEDPGLAVASETRNKMLPDVPTFREDGYDIVMAAIKGVAVPKQTPDEVIRFLHDAFKKAIEDPEFVAVMDKIGEPITYKDSKEFEDIFKRCIRSAGKSSRSWG